MSTTSSEAAPTFLVLTLKAWTPAQRDAMRQEFETAVASQLGATASFIDLSQWYDRTYASAGSKDAWVWESIYGRDYSTRKAHFHGFCVPAERLDHTAVQIAADALRGGKVVLGLNVYKKLLNVHTIRDRTEEGGGWAVCGDPIG